MTSFSDILSKPSIFSNRDVLSPHFIPEVLLHREKETTKIMTILAPALKNERPNNVFIYGKSGTGKTSCMKNIIKKFREMKSAQATIFYVNCKNYNSRYRVLQKLMQSYSPEINKGGFGLTYIYEKMIQWVDEGNKKLVLVLDEIDMVKDLDDLIYTLTRANDTLEHGSLTIVGISNRTNFKEQLDPRSKSSLYETDIIFPPYDSLELQGILKQRIGIAFSEGVVTDSAINLAAALTASENGDARYALKLLSKAGAISEEKDMKTITDKEVEEARRNVDEDISKETISTLPDQQQLTLYAIANLTLHGSKYRKLNVGEYNDGFLFSGEAYEEYTSVCKKFGRKPRVSRWHQEYLNDLEMLGLITMIESGKGVRGRTRLIKIGYSADSIIKIIQRNIDLGLISSTKD